MTKKDLLYDLLIELSDTEIVNIYNEYCQAINYVDDVIYYMEELDEELDDLFYGRSATDLLNSIDFDNFSLCDDYFYYSIYGLRSLTSPDTVINYDEVVKYIIDNDDDLGDSDVRELLNSEEYNAAA